MRGPAALGHDMASNDSTLGAVEIGVLLSCILYGVTTVQVYLYSENYKSDHWRVKLIVSRSPVFPEINMLNNKLLGFLGLVSSLTEH